MEFINNISINLRSLAEYIRDSFKGIMEIKYIKLLLFLNLLVNLVLWLSTYLIGSRVSQDLIVLHYNVEFGVDLIGPASSLYIIPGLSLFILVINVLLMMIIEKDKDFFAYSLAGTSILASLFLLTSLGSLYLINFS